MINKPSSPIFWTLFTHEDWNLHIAATSKGLVFVGSPNQTFAELSTWSIARFPDRTLMRNELELHPYIVEFREYLQGTRKVFTMPADFQGTPFQIAVWDVLCDIPFGQTRSYSEIAKQIQKPNSARAVGAAIGANPLLITVPCHRVIGKNGSLTGYRGGIDMKAKLLELERNAVGSPQGAH